MLTRRLFLQTAALPRPAAPPNIVFLLADDLGYGDLGCYNPSSKIPTPRLDEMAARGMRFTDAHSPSAVCTPTRYGLLTGRYAWRTRLKEGVLDGFDPPLLEPGRMTAASLLRSRGYRTACIGKWHLGMQWTSTDGKAVVGRDVAKGFRPGDDVDFTKPLPGGPNDHGFDEFFGVSASLDMPPYCFIENGRVTVLPTERAPEDRSLVMNQPAGVSAPGFTLEGVLPALAGKAVEFIQRRREPYFLYLPLTAPHLPVVPRPEFHGKSGAGAYGDFVAAVDALVGQVLEAITASGAAENTLVLFSSDNGGLWHWWKFEERDDVAHGRRTARAEQQFGFGHQSNGPLRGTKADIWEGGHRVPLLAQWPGRIPAGAVSGQLVCLTDFLATCAEIAGVSHTGQDSISFLPALLGRRARDARTEVVLHSSRGHFALRSGDWKFIPVRGSGGFSAPASLARDGGPRGQLYNLRSDPREAENVYERFPAIVARLGARLAEIQDEWTPQPSGATARLRGVSAVNERVAWASGANGTVLRTGDGGETWRRLVIPGTEALDFRDIDAVDEQTAYVLSIGPGEASRIYKTADGGATWSLQFQNADPKAFYDAMTFWTPRRGIAVSDSVDGRFVLRMTADGGGTWDPVPPDRLPPALPGEGAFAASGSNIAVLGGRNIWIGFGSGRVLRSADGGRSWAVSVTGLAASETAGIFSIAFRDAQRGIVTGGDYRQESRSVDNAAITADGGRTWRPVRGLGGLRSAVAWLPGARGEAVLAVGPTGADLSHDGGRSWRAVAGGGYHAFSAAPAGRTGWGAGEGGRIARLRW